MWKKYHEDWERTQHYLIKSLFQDVSVLSPVPEEPISNPSSPSNYASCRPYSPLPELIIEVEKKVNLHDEPEEFYIDLERRVRKYYRKVIKNREEDFDSSDYSSEEMNKTKCISAASSDGYENTKISNYPRKSSESTSISQSFSRSVDENNVIEVKVEIHADSNSYIENFRRIPPKILKRETEDSQSSSHGSPVNSSVSSEERSRDNTQTENIRRTSPKVLKRETEDSQSSSHGSPVNSSVSSEESSEDNTQAENIRPTSPKVLKRETEDSQSSSHGSTVNSRVSSEENSGDTTQTSLDGNEEEECEDEKSKSDEESIKELEVMRGQHNITSQGSLQNEVRISDILNQSFTADDFVRCHSKSNEQLLGTSAIENSIAEPSIEDFQFSFNRCSTPRISMLSSTSQSRNEENESNENQTEMSEKSANSFQSSSVKEYDNLEMSSAEAPATDSHSEIDQSETSSTTNVGDSLITSDGDTTSEVSKIDCEVQTSPVEKTIDWKILKHNFFVGSPRIYNLCYCKNHHCID